MSAPVPFKNVAADEIKEIVRRRDSARLWPNGNLDAVEKVARITRSRAGLALSGGGIRSGAINLGFLQALNQNDVLRQFDYLSTVSGGGYVGSYLSSLAVHPDTRFNDQTLQWETVEADAQPPLSTPIPAPGAPIGENGSSHRTPKPSDSNEHARFALGKQQDGKQPVDITRLSNNGMYLKRPLLFGDRYLIGLVAINVVVLSGLLAAVTVCAMLFRFLDRTTSMDFLSAWGFLGDAWRAFAPAWLFGVIWIGVWIWSYWRRLRGKSGWHGVTAALFALLVISSLVAVAALLGTGDVSFANLRALQKEEPDPHRVSTTQSYLMVTILSVLAVSLLPYIRPKDLIRSATRPRNALDSWIFRIASHALLFGIPLCLFGFFARENISGYNETRTNRDQITRSHVPNWPKFWERVVREHQAYASLPDDRKHEAERFVISYYLFESLDNEKENVLTIIDRETSINHLDATLWFFQRPYYVPVLFNSRVDLRERKDKVASKMNVFLAQPETYTRFKGRTSSDAMWQEAKEYSLASNPDSVAKSQLRLLNWRLLADHYGRDLIRSEDTVFGSIVSNDEGSDQSWRFRFFGCCFSVFLLSGLVVNLNGTSVHGFYREQLSRMWILDQRTPAEIDEKRSPRHNVLLQELDGVRRGFPYHLLHGTLNFFGGRQDRDKSSTAPFLFSQLYCGSERTGFEDTKSYMGGKVDLADAMSISGAAVSPTVMNNWLLVSVLLLANFRLGQWLVYPARVRRRWSFVEWLFAGPPAPLTVAIEHWFCKPTERNYCLVTDGGHHENLGIEALLDRRCRLIVAMDAGGDPTYSFTDFLRVVRRSRTQSGIRLLHPDHRGCRLSLDRISPNSATQLSQSHYLIAHIQYPRAEHLGAIGEVQDGYLIYLKSSLTGDEELDLLKYREENPAFPHDNTLDQFYDLQRFEAYRQLGFHVGHELCCDLMAGVSRAARTPWLSDWSPMEHPSDRVRESTAITSDVSTGAMTVQAPPAVPLTRELVPLIARAESDDLLPGDEAPWPPSKPR